MARRDGNRPQVDFPQLIADVIDQLNVRGPLGVLDLSDEVRPVFIIGSRTGSLQVTSNPVDFTSANVFAGSAIAPAANTVVADTGQLPAGTYDVLAHLSISGIIAGSGVITVQHRNAANAATLATILSQMMQGGVEVHVNLSLPLLGYQIATDERIRLIAATSGFTLGGMSGSIWARRRVVP